MRISDWSSDVCSSDLLFTHAHADHCHGPDELRGLVYGRGAPIDAYMDARTRKLLTTRFDYAFVSSRAESNLYPALLHDRVIEGPFSIGGLRSEEHTSELQSLMRISYAVFFLKKKIII